MSHVFQNIKYKFAYRITEIQQLHLLTQVCAGHSIKRFPRVTSLIFTATLVGGVITMSLILQERKLRYKSVSTLPKVLQRADGGAKIQPNVAPEQMLLHTRHSF